MSKWPMAAAKSSPYTDSLFLNSQDAKAADNGGPYLFRNILASFQQLYIKVTLLKSITWFWFMTIFFLAPKFYNKIIFQ